MQSLKSKCCRTLISMPAYLLLQCVLQNSVPKYLVAQYGYHVFMKRMAFNINCTRIRSTIVFKSRQSSNQVKHSLTSCRLKFFSCDWLPTVSNMTNYNKPLDCSQITLNANQNTIHTCFWLFRQHVWTVSKEIMSF